MGTTGKGSGSVREMSGREWATAVKALGVSIASADLSYVWLRACGLQEETGIGALAAIGRACRELHGKSRLERDLVAVP